MTKKKLRIALICDFSNFQVVSYLRLHTNLLEKILLKIKCGRVCDVQQLVNEHGIWITNAIKEYEKINNEIDLHVISPHAWMKNEIQEFEINNIHYHFFQNEEDIFLYKVIQHIIPSLRYSEYKRNRKYIKSFVDNIHPDIVYISGAENPHYSLAALDIPKDIPLVVHLQTLMNDSNFESNYPIEHARYVYRANNELKVLERADYICTSIEKFVNIIQKKLIPTAKILSAVLAVGEDVKKNSNIEKKYDFVYFAADISKAVDLAIEGFFILHKKKADLKLLIVGFYDENYKRILDEKIVKYNLKNNIVFTGRLPTHQDVLDAIQQAKYALLPLKIDITSCTIREAMACGLPVITTITENGTPFLNEKRETVLLSEIGDHQALANNMMKLIENPQLAESLKKNGELLLTEKYSNYMAVQSQKNCLFAAYYHFKYGIPISTELLS
ncbi:MAG: glycosyltransferase family 4 protein [Bacteroidales bacterium]|nr:glycosyltransferase family 4 protein [Bacteroidales bacterium]